MRHRDYIFNGYLNDPASSENVFESEYESKLRRDVYHYLITSSWLKVFFAMILWYFSINLIFATIYWLIPDAINNTKSSFYDAFFFSIQTFSTIGYGHLSPTGILSNIIVTFQSALGIISMALITGIVFSKFSKPTANIVFSKNMILSTIDGQKQLSFRMGNMRANDIVEVKVVLSALVDEKTAEGNTFRRIYDLKLKRANTPFFKLTWSLFHTIDETSPISTDGQIRDNLKAIAVTVTGHDSTFSSTVFARHLYTRDEIIKDKYFVDIMEDLPDGRVRINYKDFNKLNDLK